MTDNENSTHPEEGTIHAWLDGALGPEETARLEAHVATCGSCAARVAEARGLIAGASRVVGLLDDAPKPLIRPASTPTSGGSGSVWRTFRVTPARAAIAAVLLVAVGITLTRQRVAVESTRVPADSALAENAQVAASTGAPAAASTPAVRDSVLGSAIARRLAAEQPPRTVEAAPGVAIQPPPPGAAAPAQVESGDAIRVATGRASIQAQRESATAVPDRTRAGIAKAAPGFNAPAERVVVAAKAADSVAQTPQSALMDRSTGVQLGAISPGDCFRVEGAQGATWGPVPLPMIVAVDSSGRGARILAANGAETEARAALTYSDADSVVLRLRRIGYNGTMTLGAIGASRTGTMRSNQLTRNLESVVTTGVADARAGAAQRRAAASPAAAARNETESGTLVAVTAHRVSCPSP